jgi:hypothetical protein
MKKYSIDITATARATVVVRAPDKSSALEFLKENFDGYNLNYEIDEMCAEVDADYYSHKLQRDGMNVTVVDDEPYGVTELEADDTTEADYVVSNEWLEDSGYEVVTTIRKRENV